MKCGKCGNNEATFHYKSMVNGNMTELHLCQDCAGTEEFAGLFDMGSGMDSFFEGSFMRPFARAMNAFARPKFTFTPMFGVAPVFFAPYRAPETPQPEIAAEASESRIPTEVDPEVSKRRELHSLKFELKKAVKAEEFERAAELRDKIREIEAD